MRINKLTTNQPYTPFRMRHIKLIQAGPEDDADKNEDSEPEIHVYPENMDPPGEDDSLGYGTISYMEPQDLTPDHPENKE